MEIKSKSYLSLFIPQVAENLTQSNSFNIPDKCPVCNQATKIIQSKETKVLHCTNKDCLAKHIGLIVHYVGRDAMNIEGLSEASFEKFMSQGLIHDLSSIYHLKEHKETIENLEGWGEKSFSNLVNAIEKSRVVDMPNFLYALGITQVGKTASKAICNHFEYNFNKIMNASEEELTSIADIGPITAKELVSYMKEEKNISLINNLLKEITFKAAPIKEDTSTSPIKGLTFVVTGDVFSFKNRKELSVKIESLGGKVTGSVSAKTDYLINNDIDSTSGKNKKAKEVNEKAGKEVVKIINETQFLELINQ